jgi:fibronectin type 3 domain-containing protein
MVHPGTGPESDCADGKDNDCDGATDCDDADCGGVPSAPTGVSATDGDHCDRVEVSWSSVSGADSYEIHRATSSGDTYSSIGTSTLTTYDDTAVTPGTTYYYKVLASNACGDSALSGWDDGYADTPPAAPGWVNLRIIGQGCGYIDVGWETLSDATRYEIYRSTSSGGSYSLIGEAYPSWPGLRDYPPTANVNYYYKVKACDACGCSGLSVASGGQHAYGPPDDAPTGLTATTNRCDRIQLSWNDVECLTHVGNYNLYRASSPGGTYTLIAQVPDDQYNSFCRYDDNTPTPGSTYYYKVAGSNLCGEGTLTDWEDGLRLVIPAVPTGLNATDSDSGLCGIVRLTWNAVPDVWRYELEQSENGGAYWYRITTLTETSYDHAPGMTGVRLYRVRALSSSHTSCRSGPSASDEGAPGTCP